MTIRYFYTTKQENDNPNNIVNSHLINFLPIKGLYFGSFIDK